MLGACQPTHNAMDDGVFLQALLIEDLDHRLDALRAQRWSRRRSQGTVAQEQCLVVAFGQLRCLSNREWADSHSDGDGGRAIVGHGGAKKRCLES
jgi:hypothetical protein